MPGFIDKDLVFVFRDANLPISGLAYNQTPPVGPIELLNQNQAVRSHFNRLVVGPLLGVDAGINRLADYSPDSC